MKATKEKVEDVKAQENNIPEQLELREIKKLSDDYIIDDETYFADNMYVTNSMLKTLLTGSTYNLEHYINSEHKETESLIVGSAFHCYLLERDEFDSRYVYEPKFDKRTKAGKEAYAEFEKTLDGRKPIPEHYQQVFETIMKRLDSHDNAREMIKDAPDREVIHFWEDVKTGLKCKGKVDAEGKNYLLDIKTTSKKADMVSFQKYATDYMLAQQAAFYINGTGKKDFYFILFELKAPYNIAVYKMSDNAISYGSAYVDMTLNMYKEWKDSGESWKQHLNAGRIILV
tara:strand:- start:2369 stop:3226 length:858 start_codon:yes stop_codon:yes gene_type:complete